MLEADEAKRYDGLYGNLFNAVSGKAGEMGAAASMQGLGLRRRRRYGKAARAWVRWPPRKARLSFSCHPCRLH